MDINDRQPIRNWIESRLKVEIGLMRGQLHTNLLLCLRIRELPQFELLHLLLANAGRVLPRETLIDRVWGNDYVGDTKTLDVHIKRLRAKIESDPANPDKIITIRGLGYKFERSRS